MSTGQPPVDEAALTAAWETLRAAAPLAAHVYDREFGRAWLAEQAAILAELKRHLPAHATAIGQVADHVRDERPAERGRCCAA